MKLSNTKYVIVVLVLLSFALSSYAEQFTGGYSLNYVTSTRTLPKSSWQINGYSHGYAFDLDGDWVSTFSHAAGITYGLSNSFEVELSAILYQDTNNSTESNIPDDIYLRWKWGNRQIGNTPIFYGLQSSLRYQVADSSNTILEPEYDSGGNTVSLFLVLSYYRNLRRPEEGFQFHYNFGYVNYNDAETISKSTDAFKFFMGAQIPLASISPSLSRLQYLLELQGTYFLGYPEFAYRINSIEEFAYLTSSLRFRINDQLSLNTGLDVRVFQKEQMTWHTETPILAAYPNYPTWRFVTRLTYTPNTGYSGYGGGMTGFGSMGGGYNQPMGGGFGAPYRGAMLYDWTGGIQEDIQYLEIELDQIRQDRMEAEEQLQRLQEELEERRQRQQSSSGE